MQDHASKPLPGPSSSKEFSVEKLRQAVALARKCGFQVRSEWLGGSAQGWCEVAGKRILFVDLSLSIEEQLEQVEEAIRSQKRAA